MAAESTMEIELVVRWWVPVYLKTLGFLCCVMGTEPNLSKVLPLVIRGMRMKIGGRQYRLNGEWLERTA